MRMSRSIETAAGKIASVKVKNADLSGKIIGSITTIGKDDPTAAETQLQTIILRVLQGGMSIVGDNPWYQQIWLPSDNFQWPAEYIDAPSDIKVDVASLERPPNASQLLAINHMLQKTNASRFTVVQGPPGTGAKLQNPTSSSRMAEMSLKGKTTVIATFVQVIICGIIIG